MNNSIRSWMYERLDVRGHLDPLFVKGVQLFIDFACSQHSFMDGTKIRCPCTKCKNRHFDEVEVVMYHLCKYGFVPNYFQWDRHGEKSNRTSSPENATSYNLHEPSSYQQMVFDAAGPSFAASYMAEQEEEEPNLADKKFFNMLNAADNDLFPGCTNVSQLSCVARMLNLKSENHASEQLYDGYCELINDLIPEDNNMVRNFYETKKMIGGLGLPMEKIDCCKLGCMLYWKEDKGLLHCKFCSWPRYKNHQISSKRRLVPCQQMFYFPLIPRLKRLYASNKTAASMRWHVSKHEHDDGFMCHPSDSKAWKHFDETHPSFATESRNVRLGLCTDGFQPFGQFGQNYSCWPVIITPYNLPPNMCMKQPYMFLTSLIPGPKNPKHKLDVFLQPIIEELKLLWEEGVETYDVSLKQNFRLKAALMWTISDFPAYAMLSGWSTAGKMACPYCMENSQAFSLPYGRKISWFDNHRKFLPTDHEYRRNRNKFRKGHSESRSSPPIKTGTEIIQEIEELGLKKVTDIGAELTNKERCKACGWRKRSIFWDLPYWKTNLIRHNLDVMHIEKNVFENVFNTIMNIEGKTKDNAKAREDMKLFCNRKELERNPTTNKYPKASYTLDKSEKKVLCEWLKMVKFPDGYASNLSRCIDLTKCRMYGMKSHDCHIFMQRLMPIAFREFLPTKIWEVVTELSLFFKSLTANLLKVEEMEKLESEIPVVLCKLESIFVPGFFDSMEHLPIHLPNEAKLAGPVQFRWMYPFERSLHHLKFDISNKARVEGSIANAYLASEFCSHYFEPHVYTRERKVPRNDDGGGENEDEGNLAIFTYPGRSYGKVKTRRLEDDEYEAAHSYILLNCDEVQPYVKLYEESLKELSPNINDAEIADHLEKNFASWFEIYVRENEIENKFVRDLSKRPLRRVRAYPIYFVNGYKFHTREYGSNKTTMNSGICISSEYGDYFGQVVEVLELEYPALPIKRTVLFKCDWYDPTPNLGTKVHPNYNFVEINQRRRYKKFEPFVLAMQATQVCFISYPSCRRDKADWLAVCKVKPRGWRDTSIKDATFQLEEVEGVRIGVTSAVGEIHLSDGNNVLDNSSEVEEEDEIDNEEEEIEDEELDLESDEAEDDYTDDSD